MSAHANSRFSDAEEFFEDDPCAKDALKLMSDIEDIASARRLTGEEKLFFVEVLAAFYGSKKPDWDEVSKRLPDEPRVKEACKAFFKKHKLKMSDIEKQ